MKQKIENIKQNIISKKEIGKNSIILSWCIALFVVIFLWWFWSKWIYALGFNMSILWIWITLLFLQGRENIWVFIKSNLYWILPVLWIIVSFSLYENPFLKTINIFLLPLLIILFFSYTRTQVEWSSTWNWRFLCKIISRKFSMQQGQESIIESMDYWEKTWDIVKKIWIGISILLILNVFIISLLSSADSNFWEIVSNLLSVFNFQTIIKISVALFLLVFFTALKISWESEYLVKNILSEKKRDSIIAWIVIWGTLITYLVFIASQIDTITTNSLPETTSAVVSLAKNGFWQLFFVSIINIVFFFVYFRKTNPTVQNLLLAFVIASLIILLSAGHKMFIYVYYYGLSYEKLFASYTVLYFWVLFMIMLYFICSKKQIDILKTSMIIALTMYSFLNIFPTERFIFHTNVKIAQREDSKINKYQSHILSIDILNSVQKMKWSDLYVSQDWDQWVEERTAEAKEKKWYEKNIHNF